MHRRRIRAFDLHLAIAVLLIVLGAPAQGLAQAVSPVTVTPKTLAPQHRDGGVHVDIPEAGALHVPAGAKDLMVSIRHIQLEGGFAEVAEQTELALKALRGHPISVAQIYSVASQIEAIHANAGFVLARVSVPPQDLQNLGKLRIVVTDGFIESIDVAGLPARVRKVVAARTAGLVGRYHVTVPTIEQALLIAGDVPGLSLRSTLVRGTQPGGTRIVLEGRQRLVSGSVGVDNQLDPSLGRWGVNLQVALNSPLGLGEQIYGLAASDLDLVHALKGSARERVLGGGIVVAPGSGRFSVNPEVTFARTLPTAPVGAPATLGDLRRLTLRAARTLNRTRTAQTALAATIEQIDEKNTITGINQVISHDRYVALRPGASWSAITRRGANIGLNVQLSRGLGGLGAIRFADAVARAVPFSRQGSNTDFTRLNLGAHGVWPIGSGIGISLAARGQTSFGKAMFRAEQFALEGPDGLSGYVGGRTAVDAGAVVRAEITGQFNAAGSDIAPYAFGAFGAGRVQEPTAAERGQIKALNLGAGLRTTIAGQVLLSAEYAHGLSDSASLDNTNRINAGATLRF